MQDETDLEGNSSRQRAAIEQKLVSPDLVYVPFNASTESALDTWVLPRIKHPAIYAVHE